MRRRREGAVKEGVGGRSVVALMYGNCRIGAKTACDTEIFQPLQAGLDVAVR